MAEQLAVLFYADLAVPFAPSDLNERPLGGSETALTYVARGLAGIGHRVLVVAHPGDRAGTYDLVRYVNVESDEWRNSDPDVTVVFRQLPHVSRGLPGRHRMLWAHDHIGVYPELMGARKALLGAVWSVGHRIFGRHAPTIVTVSDWLRMCFIEFARWPAQAVRTIPNAVDPSLFVQDTVSRRTGAPLRLAYTSVPERGLTLLLQRIMPAVWLAVPDVEVHVFTYQSLKPYRHLLAGNPQRIHFRGSLRKTALARELSQCELWVYPTDFPETSCIAAMEAQAAGIPVISSRRFALPETVRHGETGILVEGPIGSRNYVEGFVEATIELLRDAERRRHMGHRARQRILTEFTWDRVVAQWDAFLREVARPMARAGPATPLPTSSQ